MIPSAWIGLLGEELRGGIRRTSMVSVGLIVGVAALVYFLSLGKGTKEAVVKKLVNDLPAEEILVSSPQTDIGPLRLNRPGIFSSARRIDDDVVKKMEDVEIDADGGKVKPVKTVWRRMDATFPVSITGEMLGVSYGTDTAVSGVDTGLVARDVQEGEFAYSTGEGPVPALIPEALLEVYNSAFSRANGLPGLNPSFLLGKHFDMNLGQSSISSSSNTLIRRQGVIVGLTKRGTLLGVTVPIEYVREWNRRIGGEGSANEYTSLVIEVTDARFVPMVTESVRNMGFSASSSTGMAERVAGIVAMITAGLSLLAGVILAVAGLNAWGLFKLAALERRSVAGLWMALGATPGEVRSLLMAEAVAVGAGAGFIGAIIAAAACTVTNYAAERAAVSIPLFPPRLAIFELEYVCLGITLAALVAIIAAWPSASRLARTDPAEILAREK